MIAVARAVTQPRGGGNVTELPCASEMTEVPGDGTAPVAVQISWVAPCGTHKTGAFVLDGKQTLEPTYSDGGCPIGTASPAVIARQDARGTHRIQSDVAVHRSSQHRLHKPSRQS